MEQYNIIEIKRKIGYFEHLLNKVDNNLSKQRSKRFEIKQRLLYLHLLQKKEKMKNQVKLSQY